jgi:hypothetical protein
MNRINFFYFAILLIFSNLVFADSKLRGGNISQLIETRGGKTSCWGIVITLDKLTFKRTIDDDEITVVDSKYNRDMKDIMTWSVDKLGKRLIIKFRVGMGDFGTGNQVTVTIRNHAFAGEPMQNFTGSIPTDPL